MTVSYTYSGNIYKPSAGTTEFALTSTTGNEIKYLEKSHITVSKSTDSGATWTDLARPAAWDFDSTGKKAVLVTASVAGEWIRVKRTTPYKDRYTTFQESSLLTNDQLNEGEDFSMYVDQELFDVQNQMTSEILPNVEGLITQAQAESDPDDPAWSGDKLLGTVGAIDRVYSNLVGKGTGYPGAGNQGKHGKLRIDHDGTTPDLFFWNDDLSTPAWQQVATQGKAGTQGPKGDPPGLQTPPTVVSNVANKTDGSAGDATVTIDQDTGGDLKFTFGIPIGEKGTQGNKGDAATVDVGTTTTGNPGTNASVTNAGTTSAAVFNFTIPRGATGAAGPAPGLQSTPATASNVANKNATTLGDATATVTKNGSDELQFQFGIPVGLKGDKGDAGSGVTYKGIKDFTTAGDEPGTKLNGDFYVNSTAGTAAWTGMGGAAVDEGDRAMWNATTNKWDILPQPSNLQVDLGYTAAADRGTVTNTAGGDASITAVTGTNAGLMLPAQSTKLAGIATGAEVNWAEPPDNGSIYGRTRAAGASDGGWQLLATNPITAVTGGSGITVTGTTNRTVAITYGDGVEASAAGDNGSLTIDLDGATLSKSANGLRVASNYNAPTASAATKLSVARTLWGQSFDGSANVSGNMTAVGDITFTGAQTISTNGNNALTFNTGTAAASFSDDVIIRSANAIQLNNTANDRSVKHMAAGGLTANAVYTWPIAHSEGTVQVLGSTSAGVLSWVNPNTIGGFWNRTGGNTLSPATASDNLSIGGNVTLSNAGADLVFTGSSDTDNRTITVQAPTNNAGFGANYTLTLPTGDGAANQVLRTDGAGNLSWVNQTAAGFWSRTGGNTLTPSNNGDNVNVGGTLTVTTAGGDFVLTGSDDTPTNRTITFQAPTNNAGFTANYTLTLPATDGAADEVLRTDGAGNLSWVAQTGGGATVTVIDDLSDIASPDNGDLAYCTDDGRMYVRYVESITDAAATLNVTTAGTGYAATNGVELTGGTGEGCIINITAVGGGGALTDAGVTLVSGGAGYAANDVLTVPGGDGAGRITIQTIGDSDDAQWVDSSPNANGHWTRTGTTLSPGNAGDDVEIGGQLRCTGDTWVEINRPTTTATNNLFRMISDVGGADTRVAQFNADGELRIGGDIAGGNANITLKADGSGELAGGNITFYTGGSVDYSGGVNLGGQTEADYRIELNSNGTATFYRATSTSANSILHVRSDVNGDNTLAFYVTAGGRIFARNTSIEQIASERRLKESISPIDSVKAWETIKSTPYYSYKFIGSDSVTYGPIVDEVPADMVVQPMVEDENGVMVARSDSEGPVRTYDNGMLQARLYTALQTALTRIEALEATNASLEARLNALEGGSN